MRDIERNSARCWYCKDSLGRPVKVVEREKGDYTIYKCCDPECSGAWYRSHNPEATEEIPV